jgi:CubicO group peptidase (beta-lactamase class C family)
MRTNRRQFIKSTGAGLAGLGVGGLGIGGVGVESLFGGSKPWWGVKNLQDLPRAAPESQGVSSEAIRQFVAAANASGISWHSFMLLRHGHVVAEGWWKPFESGMVHSLYSLSKSFTSTAIGLLVAEGKLDIHKPLVSFFPKDLPPNPSDHLKQITVRSLLTMNTGHGEDTMPKMRAAKDVPWVRTFLAQPVEFAPGSHFLYNTGNTYMLGAIIFKLTGKTLEQYLAPRLFEPLGISGYDWEVSPQGLNTGGYGLRVKTEDIAKLGQMYLQKGNWMGKTILPPTWVEEATSFQTTSQEGTGDWSQGYGYQFWRCTHGFYRGDGAYGQFCIVMPELDAVLAVTSQSPDMQKSMNIIWDHLPVGMQPGVLPENVAGLSSLKRELSVLRLPVVMGSVGSPMSSHYDKRKWSLAPNEFGAKTLHFDFSVTGCVLHVETANKTVSMAFAWQGWTLNDARESYVFKTGELFPMPSRIAGSAGWIDDHTILLKTRFVEAIFGDSIKCEFLDDQLTVNFLNTVAETTAGKPDPRKSLLGVMK